MTEDGLRSLDERARRLGVDRLVADADFRIANDGDLDAFIARSAAVLADILAAPAYCMIRSVKS